MNTPSFETPLGQIAAHLPASVAIFERCGLDFCCGGKLPLADACRANGLDPAAVLAEIGRTAKTAAAELPEVDWTGEPLPQLIDHILATHHKYMKAELPRLDAMLSKVLAKHGAAHSDVLLPAADIFRPMRQELEAHLWKEETVLFPLIRYLENPGDQASTSFHCGTVQNPIRVMVAEHEGAGEALAGLRNLTGGYTSPTDACATYRALYAGLADLERDLHRHIHLENNILFPRAVELESSAAPTSSTELPQKKS